MPTKRKFRMKARKAGSVLTPGAKGYLLHVIDLGEFDYPGGESAARQLWKQHRVALLTAWIAATPGTRPFAWWEWERPVGELRRHVSGSPPIPGSPIYFGYPAHWPDKTTVFETELEYLQRLKLLTREEERALEEKPR